MNAPVRTEIESGRPAHAYDRARKDSPYSYCIIWKDANTAVDDGSTITHDPLSEICESAYEAGAIIQIKRIGNRVELLDVTQAIINEYLARELGEMVQ